LASIDYGELGDDTAVGKYYPVTVKGVGASGNLSGIKSGRRVIDGSQYHSCAVATNGNAYCWGYGANGRLGNDDNTQSLVPVQVAGGLDDFIRISAFSEHHTCAVRENGEAACWGHNAWYNLGDGTNTERDTPVIVGHATAATTFGNTDLESNVIAITTGFNQSLAVHANGMISAWGEGGNGRKGDGTNANYNGTPKPVATFIAN
jgi:alpha-tubulin suppressor-like RCC1 family protein